MFFYLIIKPPALLKSKKAQKVHPKSKYCDAHRGKLGVLAIFTESSEINPEKFLFCRKPFFAAVVHAVFLLIYSACLMKDINKNTVIQSGFFK